jgi:methanogenic corrinoid protein MtbC1
VITDASPLATRDTFLVHLEARDRQGALRLAGDLTSSGTDVPHLVAILASVQLEVGRLWEAAIWTTAREHAATAIVEAVLSSLSASVRTPAAPGQVIVTCVEDEWHALPARMFSEVIRSAGYDVVFLGASLPPEDVGSFLREVDPVAVVLSCTVSMNLPGAARVIEASHAAGYRTLVGGAGFGSTPARAERLNADAWAATAAEGLEKLDSWRQYGGDPRQPGGNLGREHQLLAEGRDHLVESTMAALALRMPTMATFTPRQLSRTRADYLYITRFLEAAVLVGDDSVFSDFLEWLDAVLATAGLPPTVLPLSLEVLRGCLSPGLPQTSRLLDEGAANRR